MSQRLSSEGTTARTLPLRRRPDWDSEHLHNLVEIDNTLLSGSEPEGEAAFAQLKALGVNTIVSVDGLLPDVETAKRYGLRYVHVPIGYDGIEPHQLLAFSRVAREDLGTIYVHCHHGRHRGPTAAAIIGLAGERCSPSQAREILEIAGTSRDYAGLWQVVESFVRPAAGSDLPPLQESTPVSSMVQAMVGLDRANDTLKAFAEREWQPDPQHPDVVPHHQALLVEEGFVESLRTYTSTAEPSSAALVESLKQSIDLSSKLHQALLAEDWPLARETLQTLNQQCKQCHREHRD
jgi:protein tyrosine phosphatase (PTP) superfamily phosphohydrolase (DUF442 family)